MTFTEVSVVIQAGFKLGKILAAENDAPPENVGLAIAITVSYTHLTLPTILLV